MNAQLDFILAREAQLMYKRAREFEPVNGDLGRWRGVIPGQDPMNIRFEIEITIPPEFPRQAPVVTVLTPTDHPLVDPATGYLNLRILTYWRPEYHLYQVVNSIKGIFARTPPKLPDTFSSKLVRPSSEVSSPEISESQPPFEATPEGSSSAETSQSVDEPEAEATHPPFTYSSPMPEESPKFKELKGQVTDLEKELETLQKTLMKKEQTIARLESRMDVHNVPKYGPDRIAEILQPENPKDEQINELQSEKIAIEDLMRTLEEKFENGEIGATEYANIYKSYQKELYLLNEKLKELGINP